MGSFSIWHWLVVLLVVVLIFGTKKLKNIGSDLGGAVKGFKEGMKSGGESADDSTAQPQVTAPNAQHAQKGSDANTVDVEAKTKAKS